MRRTLFRRVRAGALSATSVSRTNMDNAKRPDIDDTMTSFTTSSERPSIMLELLRHQSFHHFVLGDIDRHPQSKVAFKCAVSGEELRYGAIRPLIAKYASVLYHRYGVRKGDTVLLLSPNQPNYVCLFHAILSLGAVVSPIATVATGPEVVRQAALGGAKVALVSRLLRGAVATDQVIAAHGLQLCFDDMPLDGVDPVPDEALTPEFAGAHDTVVLPFSSGTTGLPKGVQLTNQNLVANVLQTQAAIGMRREDVLLSCLPYYHIYGLTVMLHTCMHVGGRQITFPRFEMENYLRTLEKEKATLCFVAPPIIVGFVKHPLTKQTDTSSVRFVMSGAAPLGEDVQRLCEPLFKWAIVGQGYGLTETSPVVTITPQEHGHYGDVGELVSDTEARIVVQCDDEGVCRDVPEGQEGELWVRGPQVMKGYLKAEDTDLILPPNVGGRWLRTGDLAVFNSERSLRITDRLKELIKYKGVQVAPAELEARLQEHDDVLDAIVVGVPVDDGSGEVPRAHVVLKPGVAGTADKQRELLHFVDRKVSPAKRLRGGIKFVAEIPKSPAGKLLRRIVRDAERGHVVKASDITDAFTLHQGHHKPDAAA